MRDPYAKALRVKPQQVIPDKRTLRQFYDDIAKEEVPDDLKRLLNDLR